jgi:hypothetical protein
MLADEAAKPVEPRIGERARALHGAGRAIDRLIDHAIFSLAWG